MTLADSVTNSSPYFRHLGGMLGFDVSLQQLANSYVLELVMEDLAAV